MLRSVGSLETVKPQSEGGTRFIVHFLLVFFSFGNIYLGCLHMDGWMMDGWIHHLFNLLLLTEKHNLLREAG